MMHEMVRDARNDKKSEISCRSDDGTIFGNKVQNSDELHTFSTFC
jgi:hypothetical protein